MQHSVLKNFKILDEGRYELHTDNSDARYNMPYENTKIKLLQE